jgi:hypothetical protein
MKIGKTLMNAVIIGLLVAILMVLLQGRGGSTYSRQLGPQDLGVQAGPNIRKDPNSIFDIKPSLKCVPGPSETADYYTQGLNPGGLCGSAEYVRDSMRDYTISDGVGGSLLEK